MNSSTQKIKKLHLEAMVLFAINNIPHVDALTLKQFLELINANGSFGDISHEQILRKMDQVIKYIPEACAHSLSIMVDLLEIDVHAQSESHSDSYVPAFVAESLSTVALGRDGFYTR